MTRIRRVNAAVLSLSLVIIMAAPIGAVADTTNGLILHYPFDSDGGSDVVDASGVGNDGVLIAGAWASEGHAGGGMDLNGSSAFINAGNLMTGFTQFTCAIWVKLDSFTHSSYMGLFGQQDFAPGISSTGSMYNFYLGNSGAMFGSSGWWDGTAINTRTTYSMSVGDWHHVVQTYDGTTVWQYVDGAEISTASISNKVLNSSDDFLIGKLAAYPVGLVIYYLDGRVDDVRLYDRALSGLEVTNLYNLVEQTVELVVVSDRGSPSPPAGTNTYSSNAVINAVAPPAANGGTQSVCTGWIGTGDVTVSGTSNSTSFTITTNSSITWLWGATNYYLDVIVGGQGSVDVPDGWYADGSNLTITAAPSGGADFEGWTGDVTSSNNPLVLTMDQSYQLSASFSITSPLSSGLVLHYSFDSDEGGTVIDQSGNGRDADVVDGTWTADGRVGGGMSLDGVNDYLRTDAVMVNFTQFTTVAWLRIDSFTDDRYMGLFAQQDLVSSLSSTGNMHNFFLGRIGATFGTSAYWNGPNVNTRTSHVLPVNEWHLIAQVYDGTNVYQYDNGALLNIVSAPGRTLSSTNDFLIGKVGFYPGNTLHLRYLHGTVDEIRFYDRALSASEVDQLSGVDSGRGQVLHYTFDSDTGANIVDQSGQENDGTLTGGVWTAESIVGSGAMSFDGANDSVDAGNDSSLVITGAVTLSAWVNPAMRYQGTGQRAELIAKGNSYALMLDDQEGHDGAFTFLIYTNASERHEITSAVRPESNTWYHVVGLYDQSTLSLYVDGVKEAEMPGGGEINIAAQNLIVGGGTNAVAGLMDDVQVFDRALTGNEVEALYRSRTASGLIVYYSFDSIDGSTVLDESGNGKDGTLMGGAVWAPNGRVGGAVSLDGINDYVEGGNVFSGFTQFTACAWVRIESYTDDWYMGLFGQQDYDPGGGTGNVYVFYLAGTGIGFGTSSYWDGNTVNTRLSHSIPVGEWRYIVQVYDGTECRQYENGVLLNTTPVPGYGLGSADSFLIGKTSAFPTFLVVNYLDGMVDEVRVYDRALSESELNELYAGELGRGLALYYPFDTDEGAAVTDRSGAGNEGVVTNVAWASDCIIGGGMSFDGDNDCLATPLDPNGWVELSCATWFRVDDWSKKEGLITARDGADAVNGLWLDSPGSGQIVFGVKGASQLLISSAADAIVTGKWYHAVGTYSMVFGGKLYIDGKLVATGGTVGQIAAATDYLVGYDSEQPAEARFFTGRQDEVRLYNRVLTETEVAALYVNRPPKCSLTVKPASGTAPLKVSIDFSGSSDTDGNVVRWELDYEGDGAFDLEGVELGAVVVDYPEPGVFSPVVRLIDNWAMSGIATSTVTVWGDAPVAALSATPESGAAPLLVTLDGSASTVAAGHQIVAYEWDFDGDGAYDSLSATSVVSWTYRDAAANTAVLRVTDDQGLQDTETKTVNVSAGSSPPTVNLAAFPDVGSIPLEVTLEAAAADNGSIASYEWDFDGDGSVDLTTASPVVTNVYHQVGTYVARVKVKDDSGLEASDVKNIQVTAPSSLRIWIVRPHAGASVYGNSVTLHANTAPGHLTGSVQFQYKSGNDLSWTDLGPTFYPPANSYRTTWDASALIDGSNYFLRAEATDTDLNTVYSAVVEVSVDSTPLDDDDGVEEDDDGIHHARHRFSNSRNSRLRVYDGTSVTLPLGTVNSNATVQVDLIDTNTNAVNGAARGRQSINRNRTVSIDGDPELKKVITIDIPYADVDNDGYVDGTRVAERTLRGCWFDKAQSKWRQALSCEILTEENIIRIRTYHLTEFGIFGNPNLLLPVNGGVLVTNTSEAGSTKTAANLTDDNMVSHWKSEASPAGDQVFIFAFTNSQCAVIDTAIIHNYGEEGQGSNLYSADFEIAMSFDGTNYAVATNGTLLAQEGPQEFGFGPVTGMWARLTVSSGTTNTAWELAEFELFGTVSNDVDADLLIDSWEVQYFGSLVGDATNDFDGDSLTDAEEQAIAGANPAKRDTDGDGASDGQEYVAGTGLTNALEVFEILSVTSQVSDIVFEFTTVTGMTYTVQSCTNLMTTWTNVPEPQYTNISGDGSAISYTNTGTVGTGKYFRIRVR